MSRLGGQKDTIKLPKPYLCQITNQLNAMSDNLQKLSVAMQEVDELVLLKHTIMSGWPSSIKQVPQVFQAYWTSREELNVEEGLVFKGTRIVIPVKQHEALSKLIHVGHLGLNKCKLHAKDTVYWSRLNDQLEKLVLNCELCVKYSHSKCKQEPSLPLGQEVPLYPWTKFARGIFHFEGASYLLVVDYSSRFLVVCKLTSMTGQHIATQCKVIFSKYVWPENLISDNGPCYTAEVFKYLMREYSVNHITSSPHYPQSNGLAEKIEKNLFCKAQEEGKDLFKWLMVYHNTPLSSSLGSKMQILSSRSVRSELPMSNTARKQLGLDCEGLRTKYKKEHLPLHDFHTNQVVMHQDPITKRWYPATITRQYKKPRSYIVTTKEGVQYRKTQVHLRPYQPQDRKSEDKHLLQSNLMWTVTNEK